MSETTKPLDMLIFCPHCHKQHIDKPEPDRCICGHREVVHAARRYGRINGKLEPPDTQLSCRIINCTCSAMQIVAGSGWQNPPHKSHECRLDDGGCGLIFRLADVPTNGVAEIKTVGDDDTWFLKPSIAIDTMEAQ